ncbi:CHAT domain-containing protein [Aeromicrobium alkaliterrae]|uniref:CHAT domain-containing protein n=1 Tax=Aeromicrobium alkaliterrae TaxID=302168 RepID=A0ABP4W0P9_9ACTN
MTETRHRVAGEPGVAGQRPDDGTQGWLVLQEAERRRENDPRSALRLLDSLHSAGLRHADPATSGRASLLRAEVLADLGEYERAGGAVQAARHDLLAAGLVLDTYATDVVRATLIRANGDASRGIDVLEGVLEDLPVATTPTLDPENVTRLRAHVHRQLGLSLAARAEHGRALHHFDLAWNRFHSLGDTVLAARTTSERAVSYLSLDMTHRALDDLLRARQELTRLGQTVAAARCAVPLSRAYVRLDRVSEAVHLLDDVRPLFEQRGHLPHLAALDLAMSEALLQAGLAHDARLEARAAGDLFTRLHHIEGTAQANLVTGLAGHLIGDDESAAREVDLAERLSTSLRLQQEIAILRLSEILSGPDRESIERARRLAGVMRAAAHETSDDTLLTIADLALALSVPQGPEAHRHLDAARRAIITHELHGLDVARAVVTARVLQQQHDPRGAVDEIATALTTASSPTAHVQGAYRPLAHLMMIGVADRALLDLLLEIGTPDAVTEAWRWASVTKARSLTDLASTANQQRTSVDAPLLPVHREAELETLSHALDRLIDPVEPIDLGAIRATHVAVRRDIRQQIPHARLPLTQDHAVALPPVPEGPVLQLQELGPDLVAFVIREGQVYARRLVGAASEVQTAIAEWHAECSRVQHVVERGAGWATHHSLDTLATLLLWPISDLLADLEEMPLVVVAPGSLQPVPFEALPFGGRALASAFSLRFAAGMHDLTSMCDDADDTTASGAEARMLALMVPDANAPRISDETSALAAIHPGATILTGPGATVEALWRLAPQHDVVHLACHGLYWPEHPSSSGLRLGDRWVTAGEILRMDLNGCLVILNACATGRAHDTTSESVGLTWALLAAGARGVVATTWPVDDSVALAFATSFHQHLVDGLAPAEAVQQSGIDVSEQFSDHPWAWAAHRYIAAGATVIHGG